MSPRFLQEAQRHLLVAANAWRRRRSLPELRDDSTAPPVGAQMAASPLADGPIRIVVEPRRAGRADSQVESKAISLLETNAHGVLSRYDRAFGRVYNADNASEVLGVHGTT